MSFSDPAIASRTTFPLGTTADFDHEPRVRLIFGAGCAMRAGQLARDYGARRVLLVTDPGLVAAGHAGRIQGYLEAAGLDVVTFDHADQNPTTATIEGDNIEPSGFEVTLDTSKPLGSMLSPSITPIKIPPLPRLIAALKSRAKPKSISSLV